MSNLVCSKCGSTRIMTERRPDGFHHCMYCRHSWKIGESQPKPTVFQKITASPEVLAPKLVYVIKQLFTISGTSRENPGGYEVKTKWFSTIVDGDFDSESEAIAATLAKLEEVEK